MATDGTSIKQEEGERTNEKPQEDMEDVDDDDQKDPTICVACAGTRKMSRIYYGLCARKHLNPMHKKHLKSGDFRCTTCVNPIVGLVKEADIGRAMDPIQWKRLKASWKGLRTRRDRIQMRMSSRHIPDRLGKKNHSM